MRKPLSARLLHAYRMTRYTVAGITLRIGRRSAALDRLLTTRRRHQAAFITAWNPLSRPMPPGWNCRMQASLQQAVRRWPSLPANGQWRRWSESHLVVFAPHRPIAIVARRYRQHGIVILRLRQPPRFIRT